VPEIRPFRALRFDPSAVGDLGLVTAPPYDVVAPDERRRLVARHPANVVRLDLPADELGDAPDDRYRRAARTLAGWRSDGTLRKDPHPSVYVYEQRYRPPGSDEERTQRGFFARLRLEPLGSEGGVLPHERTLAGPREDRYKLLRATGVNTSPVIGLYEDATGSAERSLGDITRRPPLIEVTDDEGVRHRLWPVASDGDTDQAHLAATLMAAASSGPVTIADGHHRYETALRYRDERRMTRSCDEDPAFDYLLMLFLDARGPLTVLPTHRLVRGIGDEAARRLLDSAAELFVVERVEAAEAVIRFADKSSTGDQDVGGRGRFGLWTRAGGALLTARRAAFSSQLPPGGEALRRLDVTLLGIALERLLGLGPDAIAAGAVEYTKSARDAIALVDSGDSDAAILLEPTPVAAIIDVARDGDVMPQKSTYFYPKALTGLVINPHEW